jgi:hypothetical protein
LNKKNPLGSRGQLAESFSSLIKEIWSSKYKYVVPQQLKSAVVRKIISVLHEKILRKFFQATFAPAFGGYSQHDAQEFMAFFLVPKIFSS